MGFSVYAGISETQLVREQAPCDSSQKNIAPHLRTTRISVPLISFLGLGRRQAFARENPNLHCACYDEPSEKASWPCARQRELSMFWPELTCNVANTHIHLCIPPLPPPPSKKVS